MKRPLPITRRNRRAVLDAPQRIRMNQMRQREPEWSQVEFEEARRPWREWDGLVEAASVIAAVVALGVIVFFLLGGRP